MGMPANFGLSIQKIDRVVSVDLMVAYFHV